MSMIRMRQALDGPAVAAVVAAAHQHAEAASDQVVIAVVDPWGHLLSLTRTANAQIASDAVAISIGTSGETPDGDEQVSLASAAVALHTTPVPALTAEGARVIAEAAAAEACRSGTTARWPAPSGSAAPPRPLRTPSSPASARTR